jgi:hypothetical protein
LLKNRKIPCVWIGASGKLSFRTRANKDQLHHSWGGGVRRGPVEEPLAGEGAHCATDYFTKLQRVKTIGVSEVSP